MKKGLIISSLCAITVFSSICYAGDIFVSKDDIAKNRSLNLVNWATKKVEKLGRIRGVIAINEYNLNRKKGAPYLFAYVCNDGKNDSFIVANGNVNLIYTNVYHIRNHQLFREALKKQPGGSWVNYAVRNPSTGKTEKKHSYVRLLKKYKLCIGSGYYSSN